jgi:single-strand DNA-binding protein
MSGINKVILIGNVGKVDIRQTQSGDNIVSLSLATSQKYTDKNGQHIENVEWHNVVFFKKLADIVAQYVAKGSKIYVEGSLKTEKYTDKSGVERYTTKIMGREMQMLGGKTEAGNASPTATAEQYKKAQETFEFDDNLPF